MNRLSPETSNILLYNTISIRTKPCKMVLTLVTLIVRTKLFQIDNPQPWKLVARGLTKYSQLLL